MKVHAPPLWTHVPEFGERVPERPYRARPGAYAVLRDAEGRIAVVFTPDGFHLPGGGTEPGETLEQALRREVAEECGLAIRAPRVLGRAIQYMDVCNGDAWVAKDGTFYLAELDGRADCEPEPDHLLLWLAPDEAMARLTHESQIWVVRQAVGTRPGG